MRGGGGGALEDRPKKTAGLFEQLYDREKRILLSVFYDSQREVSKRDFYFSATRGNTVITFR